MCVEITWVSIHIILVNLPSSLVSNLNAKDLSESVKNRNLSLANHKLNRKVV